MSLDTVLTYQALNLFALPRTFEFLKKYDVKSRIPIMNILEHPEFLAYRWIPVELKYKAKKQLDYLTETGALMKIERHRVNFLKKKYLKKVHQTL